VQVGLGQVTFCCAGTPGLMYGFDFQQASFHAQAASDNLLLVAVSASAARAIGSNYDLIVLLEAQACLVKMAKCYFCTAALQPHCLTQYQAEPNQTDFHLDAAPFALQLIPHFHSDFRSLCWANLKP